MLDSILVLLMVISFITALWLVLFLLFKVVDEYDIDLSDIFNRKVVDIPDFVNVHRKSQIEYLFNERRKNDNEIQI